MNEPMTQQKLGILIEGLESDAMMGSERMRLVAWLKEMQPALIDDMPKETCGQCGQPYEASACGPTHALVYKEKTDKMAAEAAMKENPICPFCEHNPLLMSTRGPIQLGNLFSVVIYCDSCKRTLTVNIVGRKNENKIIQPAHPS